jgi:hypothetical protein
VAEVVNHTSFRLNAVLLGCAAQLAPAFVVRTIVPASPTATPSRPLLWKNTPFRLFVVPLGCTYQPGCT